MISENLSYPVAEEIDLLSLLEETAVFLWKEWPKDMRISRFTDRTVMTLVGTCPHCGATATFEQAAGMFQEQGHQQGDNRAVAAMRCIACDNFILAIAKQMVVVNAWQWVCVEHYPLGKPNDKVSEHIPENVASDFKEAVRCQWVNAYNATAEMCRRAVEASCINLGAPYSKVLQEMIDYLHSKGIITEGLKNVAHKVRLGGDRGAHPPEDPNQPPKYEPMIVIEKDHAEAIVNFTRHFLDHVYVIPKQLPTYDFSKPKKLATT